MPVWKPLPADLDPGARRLAVRLRELKDHTGFSTGALARKTPFSASSWDRYLNGRAVPPKDAVLALAELADADSAQLSALWEVAAADRPVVVPAETVAVTRNRRTVLALAGAALLLSTGSGAIGWWIGTANRPETPRATVLPQGYSCDYTVRDGRLYAGHSDTTSRLVEFNVDGDDVAEVQCLLKRHGFDPGRVDGLFGEHTQQAVSDFERKSGLAVDGAVTEQTWAALRRNQ